MWNVDLVKAKKDNDGTSSKVENDQWVNPYNRETVNNWENPVLLEVDEPKELQNGQLGAYLLAISQTLKLD